jgi:phenylpropionate dioxygenase-like ring-hydroxylating dioxygenase large terminal subunit
MKPVNFYFDHEQLVKEKILFDQVKFLTHELNLGQDNNFLCIPQENEGRVLIKKHEQYLLLSNICRHRQAAMLSGQGLIDKLTCPLHSWTYNLDGKLITAPHFDPCPDRNLEQAETIKWNGLIFQNTDYAKNINLISNLNQIKFLDLFKFNNYALHSTVTHECNYNWKTFIEVYLDDYHVNPFHPGLGNFVDCSNLEWQFGHSFSVQSVGVCKNLRTPGTPVYKTWHDELMKYRKNSVPDYGAIWLTIYPNIMLEWYPEVLVISTLWPETPQKTKNIVQFYYPEDICYFEPEFVAAHQAAYMETCDEDDEIAERMDQGRKQLFLNGKNDSGPIQNPMELGLEYFYKYYNSMIGIPGPTPVSE